MRLQQQVLTVKCQECGAKFDLWQDLLASGNDRSEEEIHEFLQGNGERLCWRCRDK